MTLADAAARLRERANGVMSGDDVRAMATALYGKATNREMTRLLREVRYFRFASIEGGRAALDPAYIPVLRRDFSGPISVEAVPLAEGPDVVAVEDGASWWYIVPQGAVMRLNHWLAEKMGGPAA